jgi:hypothetical protein
MHTMDQVDRFVVARNGNVLRVDFHRKPEPPPPPFPGAGAMRSAGEFSNRSETSEFTGLALQRVAS